MKTLLTGMLGVSLLIAACKTPANPPANVPETADETARINQTLIRRNGQQLVLNGQPIQLNGMAFGNWVWDESGNPPVLHHNEQDYARLQQSGLNCVRFYLNYKHLENDATPYTYKQTGWDWLNQNIAWAKKHGVYLILNVHVPQGGYQSQGKGGALWDVPENQNRLTAMWREIARRYRTEPTIAGYDLVNEPVVTRAIDQWQSLAQRLTTSIREVDKHHLIIVERLNAVGGEWKDVNGERNMFLVNDDNVMYQFHMYDPYEYTHQTFSWANRPANEFETYPDASRIAIPSDASWYTAIFDNPALPAGTSAWQAFEGVRYKATDPKLKVGGAVCAAANVGAGRVYFDDVVLKEYDANGQFVRNVVSLPMEDTNGWYFWSKNTSGTFTVASAGRTGRALSISGTTDDANAGFYQTKFAVKPGYSYQISGWMRGDNVPATAGVRLRVDFETTNQPILSRDKAYLKQAVQFYADWGKKNNVPIYLGEYGAGAPCFRDGRGGVQWVSDMIDINRELGFHTTYHTYHEDSFGLYFGGSSLPDPANANTALIELFRQKFGR